MKTSPKFDIDNWRSHFPILKNYAYLANCSQAPQSDFTRQAALNFLDSWNCDGMNWDRWLEEVHLAKTEFARLIGAVPSEIAVGTSVSELTSLIASCFNFSGKKRKVVLTEAEFPTVGYVWQAQKKRGAEIRFINIENGEISLESYQKYVDLDTIITSICDVYYYNGFKQDLAQIIPVIHEKGSLVYLDAYQGIGTHPIDVKELDVDFLVSGTLKYLLGTAGIAFLYVKKELISELEPSVTGWFAQENPFSFNIRESVLAATANRFENGTPPIMAAYVARAGMAAINQVGAGAVQEWTEQLSRRFIRTARERGLEVASPAQVERKSPTTAIRVPGDSHQVEVKLREKNVIASARSDVIRIAPHFFTTMAEMDYAIDCLAEIVKNR